MSKSSRKNSSARRADERRKRKLMQKALYEQYAREGNNGKSARSRNKARAERKVRLISHPLGPCGNVGCERCFPQFRRRRMNEAPAAEAAW